MILQEVCMDDERRIDVFWCVIYLLNMIFSVKLERMFYFQGFEGILEWNSGDFWWCKKWWNAWFWWVLSKWVSNSKWGLRCGNIRYALPGFRLLALKCKLRPLMVWKYTIIVQYYGIFLSCQVKILYTCECPACYSVKQKYLTRFRVRLREYRIFLFTITKQKVTLIINITPTK